MTTDRVSRPFADDRLDVLSSNVIRGLVIDAIEQYHVGHPGMPLGMAHVATVLWSRFLCHNPTDPTWFNRDRFVLSAGHGSMLLYSLLHLAGYDLPMEQLKRHRRLHSLTPGHPELGRPPGVETTTGPLGQGFANAVGMALAEALLAATFNRPGYPIVDHFTYCVSGDGDMEEGITHEAASLAGHLKLGKLICLYDDNRMTIDGPTTVSFTENVKQRFDAYGWHVQAVDGHDVAAVAAALAAAQSVTDRPSLIACRTIIGYGSPHTQNTNVVHATPLGAAEARLTKRALGLPEEETYWVPDEVREHWRGLAAFGQRQQEAWNALFARYAEAYPDAAQTFRQTLADELPAGWDAGLPAWEPGVMVSPKAASQKVLNVIAGRLPSLVGGSADLTDSNQTRAADAVDIGPGDFRGRYVHYGIREHAMAGMMNGMALHGGIIPYSGTYLVFSDYMRGAVRCAAMMKAPVIYVWTHDSVSVGPDGPTHQPVEHAAALRCIPNLVVFRPADANETVAAWRYALTHRDRPVALLLARQALPVLPQNDPISARNLVAQGAYVIADAPDAWPDVILIAAGSEVAVALAGRDLLAQGGVQARVVSIPSWELFREQDAAYREAVLPAAITARVAVEAGVTFGWERWVGLSGAIIGIDRFGECGPGPEVLAYLGITPEHVAEEALRLLGR
ncbi:MAG: transketolase [Chloroflexi bacterium]|nr:transketolase [Chloroflexota bacterium]